MEDVASFMDGTMRNLRGCALVLLWLFAGCHPAVPPVETLPEVPRTLEAIGRRLARSMSEARLTELAQRGPALLAALSARERDILSRGYLRFHTQVPVTVDVAAPKSSVPFWIPDQGFVSTGITLVNEDARWVVFRKVMPAGWVGLGVNGLDQSSQAHYVVFLRSLPGAPSLTRDAISIAESAGCRWIKVEARLGRSAVQEFARPFELLPEELNSAVLLQPSHDQRHATLLAAGRIWKTHVAATSRPDQVTIAYGEDPARELVLSWRTRPDVQETVVRIVPARFESAENDLLHDPDLSDVKVVRGSSTLVRSPNVLNDPVIRRHVAKLSDLSPDTTYLYSLGDGRGSDRGPWRTVKTGRARSGRIEFLYMGDAQTGLEAWGRRLLTAYRHHPGIEFILLAGDLVDRGNERTNWDHFFLRSEEVFQRTPLMPCAGNHEYLDQGPRLYRSLFTLPANGPAGIDPGLVYSFESGPAFFAILDSTLAVSDSLLAIRQAKWLDAALSRTHARWKFVVFHHPVYASHPRRENPNLQEHWVPVFDKHHVDMVLQGHDHAYLRTYAMRGGRPVAAPREGTIYVVAVAGDKFYDQSWRDYIEVGFTGTSTYQTIEIDDIEDRLTYRAWNDGGGVLDRVIITKPGTHGRKEFAREVASGNLR
jgi:3',5'-cyclic AMP phosphodiesterase CpdA